MGEIKRSKNIIALVDDLLFSSRIREGARGLDITLEFVRSQEGLAERLNTKRPSLVILDLDSRSANPLQAIRDIKSSADLKDIPILGYLSHVKRELKEEAVRAGCNLVLPRSRFARDLREILTRYTI